MAQRRIFDDGTPDYGQSVGPDISNPYGSFMSGVQPQAPSFGQAFIAGAENQQNPRNRLLGGLAAQSGAGGIRGGIGRIASFLI
jgi:hypothetical protein